MDTSPNTLQMKRIEIAKAYTVEVLKPGHKDRKVNVYISGSVSYGFCDELSDIEMEFYFPQGSDPSLVQEVEKAIRELHEFQGVRMSAGISRWPLEQIANGDLEAFWQRFNPYTLIRTPNGW
jgi:hypothetical protein